MTVPTTIDAAGWLRNYLDADDGDHDLARDMLRRVRAGVDVG